MQCFCLREHAQNKMAALSALQQRTLRSQHLPHKTAADGLFMGSEVNVSVCLQAMQLGPLAGALGTGVPLDNAREDSLPEGCVVGGHDFLAELAESWADAWL